MPGSGYIIDVATPFGTLHSNPFALTAPSQGGFPNRPVGYTDRVYISGDTIVPGNNVTTPWQTGYGRRSGGVVTQVNKFGYNWLRTHWGASHPPGSGVVTIPSWSTTPAVEGGPYYDNVYLSFMLNPGGDINSFENSAVGMKLAMIGSGNAQGIQECLPFLQGVGGDHIASSWSLRFGMQNVGASDFWPQNIVSTKLIISGQPNQIEFVMHTNPNVAVANGVVIGYVNGTRVLEHDTIPFRISGKTSGFHGYKFYQNLTATPRTRADDVDFAKILMATL